MAGQQSTPGALVLYPLKFAGATPGVIVNPPPPVGVPAEGLPHSSFIVVTKRDGSREGAVQAIVDPPKDSYLNIVLYMKGPSDTQPQLIERRPVDAADPNKQVVFYVYQSLLTDGVSVFFYVVERSSGNSEKSIEYWALYHRDLPGGNVVVPVTGDHPQLKISFPPELGDPPRIGKDEVDRGVYLTVFYPFMNWLDTIILEIGRERFNFLVQEGEEGFPKELLITKEMFKLAGDAPMLKFAYTVRSQINNPTHNRRWSQTRIADVDSERVTLQMPTMRENPEENSDNSKEVDLDKLNGEQLTVLAHLHPLVWMVGDSIKWVWTAVLDGLVVATHEYTEQVTQVPLHFVGKIPHDKIIPRSTVELVYQQVRSGSVVAVSAPAIAKVVGVGVLNPPILVKPAVNPLVLWLYSGGVTVRVEFQGMLAGDEARLIDVNPPGGATPFPKIKFNANKRTNTLLPQAFLTVRHGKPLNLLWALYRAGKEIGRSAPLKLNVDRIADDDPRFPTLVVAGQTGLELDVTKLVAGDLLSIAPWLLQEIGQYIWLRYDGFDVNGVPISFDDLSGVVLNQAQGLTQPALVAWMQGLKDGTDLVITFWVNFAKVANFIEAVMLPKRTYKVKSVPKFVVDQTPINLVGANISIQGTALDWPFTGNDPAGTNELRPAKGGVLPYRYMSSNDSIVSWDSFGVVRSEGNGSATLTVEDSAGHSLSISVTCANVTKLLYNDAPHSNIAQHLQWVRSVGGSALIEGSSQANLLFAKYGVAASPSRTYRTGRQATVDNFPGATYSHVFAALNGAIRWSKMYDQASSPQTGVCLG